MEFYLMPLEGRTAATTREAVLALFEQHSVRVARTETESSPGGFSCWRVYLADGESRLEPDGGVVLSYSTAYPFEAYLPHGTARLRFGSDGRLRQKIGPEK